MNKLTLKRMFKDVKKVQYIVKNGTFHNRKYEVVDCLEQLEYRLNDLISAQNAKSEFYKKQKE